MAILTTTAAIGQRESLSDTIYSIDPREVPMMSAMKKKTTSAINEEFQVQELAAAADTNYVNEGADYSYVNPELTVRLGNIHQISVKAAQVSNTLDAVDKAGRAREEEYVKILKGVELKKDINKSFYKNEAKSSSDPRKAGKLPSWLTNASVPSDMAVSAGTGADVADFTGTAAALTLAKIDAAMLAAYQDGGNPTTLIMSPVNKGNFSGLSSGSVATNQITSTAPKEASIVGSVSLYLSDFGTLNVTGRDFSVQEMAPTGDSTKFAITTEYTLIPTAPKAHAYVGGLNGS